MDAALLPGLLFVHVRRRNARPGARGRRNPVRERPARLAVVAAHLQGQAIVLAAAQDADQDAVREYRERLARITGALAGSPSGRRREALDQEKASLERELARAEGLGLAVGTGALLLATTFADCRVHRAMHRFRGLGRRTHQLPRSAERVDLVGIAVAHPLELVLAVPKAMIVGSLAGAPADAVVRGGYLTFVTQLFLHLDIEPPRWIGWLLQRPEAHRVHQTRGVHADNCGLPLWDALFGTLRNGCVGRRRAALCTRLPRPTPPPAPPARPSSPPLLGVRWRYHRPARRRHLLSP